MPSSLLRTAYGVIQLSVARILLPGELLRLGGRAMSFLNRIITVVAVEADWPDAYHVNRYVRGFG